MRIIFHGRIIPERVDVNISSVTIVQDESTEITINCKRSVVTIDFTTTVLEDIYTFKNIAEDMLRMLVDSLGYTIACGYDVEIDSYYMPESRDMGTFSVQQMIFSNQEDLELLAKGQPPSCLSLTFHDIVQISGRDSALRWAMTDFREAIRTPNYTAFHCMRAIESLSHSEFIGDKNGKRLDPLLLKLSISRRTLGKINTPGNDQRHGKPAPQTWEERKFQLHTTWEIIRRFLMMHTTPTELANIAKL